MSGPSTPCPRSPRSPPNTPLNHLRKLGSISFGKNINDAADQAELDWMTASMRRSPSSVSPQSGSHPDTVYLSEGEMRSYLDPRCLKDPAVKEILDCLLSWLNDSLANTRVRILDLEDDLKDGMVFKLILEKLTGEVLELPCGDFVQSRERQQTNLEFVMQRIRDLTGASLNWKADTILSGDLYSVISILVIIIRHFQEEGSTMVPDLPKSVKVTLLKVVMRSNGLQYERQGVNLMGREELGKRDGFDTLIDHTPEKLHFVKQSLVQFSNQHLSPLGHPVTDLGEDFQDGVRLILLIGSLEGYFIPLYSYHLEPANMEQKMFNMTLAFRNRPSEIVHKDLKATLRLIYSLFIKYKLP